MQINFHCHLCAKKKEFHLKKIRKKNEAKGHEKELSPVRLTIQILCTEDYDDDDDDDNKPDVGDVVGQKVNVYVIA